MYKIIILVTAFSITSLTWSQTEPVKLLTATDIAKDPSLHLSKETADSKLLKIENDSLVIASEGNLKAVDNPVLHEVVTEQTHPQLVSLNLQDNPELAAIDAKWMELVKQSDLYDSASYNIQEVSLNDLILEELPTELLKERLQTLDAKTPFHITYNPDLERIIKTYLKRFFIM